MGVIIFRSRRRKRRAGALQRMLTRLVNRSYGVIALALVVVAGQHLISGEPRTFALPDRTPVPPVAIPSIDREATTAAIDPAMGRSVAATLEFCGSAARIDCVVDGDTIWLSGENIRIADIDTPEIFTPQCDAEQARGEAAMPAGRRSRRSRIRMRCASCSTRSPRATPTVMAAICAS